MLKISDASVLSIRSFSLMPLEIPEFPDTPIDSVPVWLVSYADLVGNLITSVEIRVNSEEEAAAEAASILDAARSKALRIQTEFPQDKVPARASTPRRGATLERITQWAAFQLGWTTTRGWSAWQSWEGLFVCSPHKQVWRVDGEDALELVEISVETLDAAPRGLYKDYKESEND